jgi:CRISPR-associated protein Cmr6
VADALKADWLDKLVEPDPRLQPAIMDDYDKFFGRWKASFPANETTTITLASRLLVGHGNASATEVGLTVHHTWGVPMIPGSALKGLCAHYTAATYGLRDDERKGAAPGDPQKELSGPAWDENRRRVVGAPGNFYRALFGAPDAGSDPASAGLVIFHDALYVPGSASGDKPFAVDVLTVHQRSYYGQEGETQPGPRWPNDYDSPNPVGFISVKPGTQLLLAVDGGPGWSRIALNLLTEALHAWGVGGKTSAGYGRAR